MEHETEEVEQQLRGEEGGDARVVVVGRDLDQVDNDDVLDRRCQPGGRRLGSEGKAGAWRSGRSSLSMAIPSCLFRTYLRHGRRDIPILLAMCHPCFPYRIR